MFPPGIEPGTFRVLGGCDNHYTTETELRSEAGETARLLQAGILCHKQSLATGQDLDIWSIPHGNGLKRGLSGLKQTFPKLCLSGRDRLVVRTLRCGRSNPGSNPGHGRRWAFCHFVTTPTFMSRKKVWPRRDSNTQPSDLESDALPLRHGVIIDVKVISNNLQGQSNVATDVTRCWFKRTSGWHKRRWYSGEHSCLPSSWPGFDSRPTHLTF